MPDKTNADWIADEAFWNEAWTDMQGRLEEDADTKRRAAFWYWLLGALLLLALAGGIFYLTQANEAIEPIAAKTPTPPPPVEVVPSPSNESSGTSLVEMNELLQPNIQKKELPIGLHYPVSIPPSGIRRSDLKSKDAVPLAVTNAPAVERIPRGAISPLIPTSEVAKLPSQPNGPIRPRWHYEIGLDLRAAEGLLGGQFRLGPRLAMGRCGTLELDLGYVQQWEATESMNPVQGFFQNTPGNSSESQMFLVNSGLNRTEFVRTHYLRAGLGYRHELGRRWSVGGRVGLNYLVAARLQSVISGVTTNLEDLSAPDPQAAAGGTNRSAADLLDINRWRPDVGLDLGLRIGTYWTLRTGATVYTEPLFGGTLATPNWVGEVGITYRFGGR